MKIEPFETCDGCEALVCLDLGKCSKDAHRTLKISGWLNQSTVIPKTEPMNVQITGLEPEPDNVTPPQTEGREG